MMDTLWIENYLEGNSHGLIVVYPAFASKDQGKSGKTWVTRTIVLASIWTEYLLNISQEYYCYSNPFGMCGIILKFHIRSVLL
jgi:hypothetical protein